MARRNRLSKMRLDEISFVDMGANEHADILIVKRDFGLPEDVQEFVDDEVEKMLQSQGGSSNYSTGAIKSGTKQTRASSLKDKTSSQFGLAGRTKPLPKGIDSKGRTDADKKKAASQRAKNWQEARHKRAAAGSPAGGEFAQTSSDSKKKYGRGGTTAATQAKTPTKVDAATQTFRDRQARQNARIKRLEAAIKNSVRTVMTPGGKIHTEKNKQKLAILKQLKTLVNGKYDGGKSQAKIMQLFRQLGRG